MLHKVPPWVDRYLKTILSDKDQEFLQKNVAELRLNNGRTEQDKDSDFSNEFLMHSQWFLDRKGYENLGIVVW